MIIFTNNSSDGLTSFKSDSAFVKTSGIRGNVSFSLRDSSRDTAVYSLGLVGTAEVELLPLSFASSVLFEVIELVLNPVKVAKLAKLAAVKAFGESLLIFGGAKGEECLS